jgi:hypothetical protein
LVEACRRWPSADALRGLFHGARFIQHAAPLDRPVPAALPDADPPETMWREAFSGGVAPIFFAHRIKTTAAALRLGAAIAADPELGERGDVEMPVRATSRFLRAPIAERRNDRRAAAARRFVHEGRRLGTRLGY